jgi:hypothetical protein
MSNNRQRERNPNKRILRASTLASTKETQNRLVNIKPRKKKVGTASYFPWPTFRKWASQDDNRTVHNPINIDMILGDYRLTWDGLSDPEFVSHRFPSVSIEHLGTHRTNSTRNTANFDKQIKFPTYIIGDVCADPTIPCTKGDPVSGFFTTFQTDIINHPEHTSGHQKPKIKKERKYGSTYPSSDIIRTYPSSVNKNIKSFVYPDTRSLSLSQLAKYVKRPDMSVLNRIYFLELKHLGDYSQIKTAKHISDPNIITIKPSSNVLMNSVKAFVTQDLINKKEGKVRTQSNRQMIINSLNDAMNKLQNKDTKENVYFEKATFYTYDQPAAFMSIFYENTNTIYEYRQKNKFYYYTYQENGMDELTRIRIMNSCLHVYQTNIKINQYNIGVVKRTLKVCMQILDSFHDFAKTEIKPKKLGAYYTSFFDQYWKNNTNRRKSAELQPILDFLDRISGGGESWTRIQQRMRDVILEIGANTNGYISIKESSILKDHLNTYKSCIIFDVGLALPDDCQDLIALTPSFISDPHTAHVPHEIMTDMLKDKNRNILRKWNWVNPTSNLPPEIQNIIARSNIPSVNDLVGNLKGNKKTEGMKQLKTKINTKNIVWITSNRNNPRKVVYGSLDSLHNDHVIVNNQKYDFNKYRVYFPTKDMNINFGNLLNLGNFKNKEFKNLINNTYKNNNNKNL